MTKRDEKDNNKDGNKDLAAKREAVPDQTKSNEGVGGLPATKDKTADKIDTEETDEVKPEDRIGGPGINPKFSVKDLENQERREQAEAEANKSKGSKGKRKYVVQGGSISPKGGGRSNLIREGEVVELSDEEAKPYIKTGRLAPHIEDD